MGETLKLLEDVGAVLVDRHFVYTSGKHGSAYINIDPLLPLGDELVDIGRAVATPFLSGMTAGFDVVAAPAVGGIRLASAVQFACLQSGYHVDVVWVEKDENDTFTFQRQGFAGRVRGQRVLVVDDIVNTGGSAEATADAVTEADGDVVGISCVVSRGNATATSMDVERFEAVETVKFEMHDADDCPHCANAVPIVTDIGHGAEYGKDHPNYRGGYEQADGQPVYFGMGLQEAIQWADAGLRSVPSDQA